MEYISRYLANGMRPHELLILKQLIERGSATKELLADSLVNYGVVSLSDKTYNSAVSLLDKTFVNSASDKTTYQEVVLIEVGETGEITCSTGLASLGTNPFFRNALLDIITFRLMRYAKKYQPAKTDLVLYEKYSRKDVCRLLNWDQDNSSTMYGYRIKHNTCPIFVTYNKDEDISESTKYADAFISPSLFSWMTRSNVSLASLEAQSIRKAQETGLDIRLFIKKSNDEGNDFYYFGQVKPISERETVQRNDKGKELPIVNFLFELKTPVPDDIYSYFVDNAS